MDYAAWERTAPPEIKEDPVWAMRSYRLGLFLIAVAWNDASRLGRERSTRELSGQLYSAVGSISAHIAEGYSKESGRDQARFYEHALGSARESVVWYYAARPALGADTIDQRLRVIAELRRLLTAMIVNQRKRKPGQPPRS